MTATIKEVAALAGVSFKTVSRVLNGEPHVREALRQRVLSAVEQLGFHPNQAARRLAGRRSYLLAFLYAGPTPTFYIAGLQAGAAQYCRAHGYHLIVEPFDGASPDRLETLDRLVSVINPDGVFVAPPLSWDLELIEELARRGVRCARIAGLGPAPGFNLQTDERGAGRKAADHLISLGHRRIGMVAATAEFKAARARYDGYCDALAAAGLPLDPELIGEGALDFESGLEAGARLLDLADRPTAIFAANDQMALGVLRAARERGLAVPGDLSLVGFDDMAASRSSWPTLTTIRQPLEQMGAAAAEVLIGGSDEPVRIWDFDLVVRESTAAI